MELEDKLPMDAMDDVSAPPPTNDPPAQETNEQREQRERDERGRFASRGDGEGPKGQPNDEIARRRYAQERDEARRRAEEADAKYNALQKRLDDMAALVKGEDPNAPKEQPDPLKPITEQLSKLTERFETQDQQREQEQQWNQVLTYADQDEARFRAQAPDFDNATQHYIKSRLSEMQALGVDQAQAEAILTQEAQQLLFQCAQQGRSPAEALYTMAKARGYTPGAVTIENRPAPQPQNFGGRSLGTGNGPAGGALTAAQIAAMSDDDYMAFRSTPEGRRAIQRAMGA